MKRKLLLLYSLLLPVCLLAENLMVGSYFEVKDIAYEVISQNPNEVKLVQAIKKNNSTYDISNTVIASDGKTYSVTCIGEYAFSGCYGLRGIFSVPNSVRDIESYAFQDCLFSVITIPESVKTIGDYVFLGCRYLSTVNISENSSLECIGKYAFQNCEKMASIDFPSSLVNVGDYAFQSCTGLTSLTIPESLKVVGVYAFSGLINLTSLTIVSPSTSFGAGAFSGCRSLSQIVIPEGTTKLADFIFYGCSNLSDIILPNTLNEIGNFAFDRCTNLTTIDIPNSVEVIGQFAFSCCEMLSVVKLPISMKNLEANAFCACSNLKSIVIPNGISVIKEETFSGCTNLVLVSLPETLASIGKEAFSNCENLQTIEIPENVIDIGEMAFWECTKLKQFNIPHKIEHVGEDAFNETAWMESQKGVVYKDNVLLCEKSGNIDELVVKDGTRVIADGVFKLYCNSLRSAVIPSSVKTIGNSAFSNCSILTTVKLSYGLEKIGRYAFCGCNIQSLSIPTSVSFIDEGAFNGCSLSTINIPEGVEYIKENTFSNCVSLSSVKLPKGLKSIGESAFYGCSSLNNMSIPESVISIGKYAFLECSLLSTINIPKNIIEIGADAFKGTAFMDALFSSVSEGPIYKENVLLAYKGNITDGVFNVKSGTRVVAGDALCGHSEITSISFPDDIISICDGACSGLGITSLKLPKKLTRISEGTFASCKDLTSVSIPNTVVSIGEKAFEYCKKLTTINIPNSVTLIDKAAFMNCGLKSITIPKSVISIKEHAFCDCDLTKVFSLIEQPFAIGIDVFGWYPHGYGYGLVEATSATLYVPHGTRSKYLVTSGWNSFTNIIEMEPDETVPVGNALVAGYSSDKALDFTNSDVSAWIATGVRGGNIQLSRVDIVPANTGIYVKAAKAGDFDVPVATEKSYYVNMFQPVVTATTVQPTVTIDGVTYQTLSFALSKETGKPGFFPNTDAKDYGNNKMYLQLPEWVLTAPTSGTTTSERVPVTIGTLGVAGFSSDKNLDFTSSDVEAWVATGFKGGNVQLSRVYAVPAGTGIYVKSKKTLTTSTTFQIPVTTEVPYYVNLFVGLPNGGTVSPTEVVGGVTMQTLTFATSKTTGKPGFFPITEDKTYGAGKMYLRLPADLVNGSDAARSLGLVFVDDDNVGLMEAETTGINDASHLNDKGEIINDKGNGDCKSSITYNLNGQRLASPRKGLNIIGGRKVVIK